MIAFALSMVPALGCCVIAAGLPTEYNVTMSDTATVLRYSEPQNTTVERGWNQSYTGSPWSAYDPGDLAQGSSMHSTSFAGASVSIQFVGTGAYFLGRGQGSVALEVDGTQSYSGAIGASGVVAGAGGLEYATHTAKLSLVSGSLTLTNVTLTTIVGGNGAITIEQEITSLDKADNTNPELTTLGKWQENNMFCGSSPNSFSCERYDCLSTDQSGASLKMAVPTNSSIAMMVGAVGSSHGPYAVILDPAPPGMPSNQTFTAAQPWLTNSKLMFFGSLDPNVKYTIQIQYIGPPSGVMEWGKAIFVVGQGGEPWSGNIDKVNNATIGNDDNNETGSATSGSEASTPLGAIIGGVVGGVALLAALGGVIWWCCRRRKIEYRAGGEKLAMGGRKGMGRKKRWRHSVLSDFEVDAVDQTNQSGYIEAYHHPTTVPAGPGAELMPRNVEDTITPLPAPWPGDVLSHSASSLSGDRGHGKSGLSSPITPSTQINHSPSTRNNCSPTSPAKGYPQSAGSSAFATYPHSGSGHPPSPYAASSGQQTSPFVNPPSGTALSPHTQNHTHYPSSLLPCEDHRQVPAHPLVVTEAEDAGRVHVEQPTVEEQVPPRYNPAWADDGAATPMQAKR